MPTTPAPPTDPYQVLRLPKDFTLEQLKSNYKRLALQLHPDKNLVSTEQAAEIFKILTESYKLLLQDYQHRQAHRPFHDLRSEAKGHGAMFEPSTIGPQPHSRQQEKKSPMMFDTQNGKFDAARFNEFFSSNKMSDPVHDAGYGDWLKSGMVEKKPDKKKIPTECRALMLHVDAAPLSRSRLTYSEMGLDEIDDFSVMLQRRLDATDLRVAYTPQQDNPASSSNPRKNYKNIGELERDRAGIRFEMSDADARAVETYQEWKAKHESIQQSHIKERDHSTHSHYLRVQNMLA